MLVLTCKVGDSIMIGDDIEVKLMEIGNGKKARIGIQAPREIPVHRMKIYQRIQREIFAANKEKEDEGSSEV